VNEQDETQQEKETEQHAPHPLIEHRLLPSTQRDLGLFPSLDLSLYPLLQALVGIWNIFLNWT
jgi:hypothetical protein